jgi:serine/threonine-protein kinase
LAKRIGKYEIQAELGCGSFGRVYRAYDPAVGRSVAIKELTSEGDPELLARFKSEAGLTGKLQHKNIVTVYDSGEQAGSPYIVMELLEGENLEEILSKKKQLSLLEKLRIMCQIADGLHYAHSCGVIHRDVKPANIMLLPTGVVKIMDFGIARLVSGGTARKTRRGELIGTTIYMSPEQFRSADADVQTDIFAFGCLFYELLSGVHPFNAPDLSAVIGRIMHVEPHPIHEVASGCPAALEALVHRAIAKDRARRYASLDDILLDAEPVMLELRHDEAARLMESISDLIAEGHFDTANVKLKQALELDPTNRNARRLRETLQEEREKRILDENIASLEQEASAKLVQRQFADAVQKLEAAIRLKPSDQRIQGIITEAKARMQANREAGRVLSDAKREVQNDRPYEARSLARKALELDREHPEAFALVKHLDESIDKIENAKRLNLGLEDVESLLADNRFESALAKLESLEAAYPGSQQIIELNARVRSRQIEEFRRERLDRLESGLAKARDLQREGQLQDAISVLESLLDELPGVPAIENLRTSLREEISAGERATGLEVILTEARTLLWSQHAQEAMTLLEEARKKYPSDSALERLLEAAHAFIADAERQTSVSKITDRVRWLRKQGQFEEALDLLKSSIRVHGQDTVLVDLSRVVGLELEDKRSIERLVRYRRDANQLMASGANSEALALLRDARTQYPAEPSLELLLAKAEESFAKHNEREIVASLLAEAAAFETLGNYIDAGEAVAKGLRRLPASKDLLQKAADLREKIHSQERERKIQVLVSDINSSMTAGDWNRAKSSLVAAQRDYPDQVIFDELAAQMAKRQRTAEVDKALTDVRLHLAEGNLERAVVALADLEPAYGSDELWKNEKASLMMKQRSIAELRRAEDLRESGKYQEAESILRRLLSEDHANEQAAAMLKIVLAELPPGLDPFPVLRPSAQRSGAEGRDAELAPVMTGPLKTVRSRILFDDAVVSSELPRAGLLKCSSCGTVLPERARFCDNCGKSISG